jgi:acyl-coenzyme A synthetase/AMP-(fatty) acid ligase
MQKYDFSALTTVLFAGEVYPIAQFKQLKNQLPAARFFNLYGPTETNVCTYYEVPDMIPSEWEHSFPIGKVCNYAEYKVIDEQSNEITAQNTTGELVVNGESLFSGYWNDEAKTAKSFYTDRSGERYYKTGDVVYKDNTGLLHYSGRRDRMIKRRGYRIEPAEVERLLSKHPALAQVAVWGTAEDSEGSKIYAAVATNDKQLSERTIKAWSKENLPDWMIPDYFIFGERLPMTASGKVDIQTLIKTHSA